MTAESARSVETFLATIESLKSDTALLEVTRRALLHTFTCLFFNFPTPEPSNIFASPRASFQPRCRRRRRRMTTCRRSWMRRGQRGRPRTRRAQRRPRRWEA